MGAVGSSRSPKVRPFPEIKSMPRLSIRSLSSVFGVLAASAWAGVTTVARAALSSFAASCRRAVSRLPLAPALLAVFGLAFGSLATAQTAHFSGYQAELGNVGEPIGIAVDGNGNVYVADAYTGLVFKETPSGDGYIQSTIANFSSWGAWGKYHWGCGGRQ